MSKSLMLDFVYSDRVFLAYFVYWIIGCYIGINFDMNLERIRRKKLPLVIAGVSLTSLYAVVSYLEFLNFFHLFSTEILKMIFASATSVMWLAIMPVYEHEGADILSPATFYIYLIHCLVIFETEHIMENMNITSTPQRFFIIFFSAYIISIVLSVLYAQILISFKNSIDKKHILKYNHILDRGALCQKYSNL